MNGKNEKLFRDPIHNVISFNLKDDTERMLFALVDTPAVQRLRHVRQMGLASYVYPGAEHSRFGHSLGTQHVARRFFDAADLGGQTFERAVTRAAALLHDTGHAAFSHAFESGLSSILPYQHEDMTCRLIAQEDGEIYAILKAFDARLPKAVIDCIAQKSAKWYHPIVSSQMDADRMDYILRDGYMSGIRNYHFDIDRIIEMLEHDDEGLLVSSRALHAVETQLISRYHMYRQVYHHKTVRGAEKLLESVFRRVADLAQDGDQSVLAVGRLGTLLQDVLHHKRFDMTKCMAVTDAHALVAIDLWSEHKDKTLARLASGLLGRRFFKTIEIPKESLSPLMNHWPKLEAIVSKHGFDPNYDLLLDTAHNKAFAPYAPEALPLLPFVSAPKEAHKANTDIRIVLPSGQIEPIHKLSPIVEMLAHIPTQIARICVPTEVRDEITTMLKAALIVA